jgi:hypothetical protein
MKYAKTKTIEVGALTLERRGCNFRANDPICKHSDVGNWRVYTEFTTADGIEVCGDFGRGYVYDTNGRKPKIINSHALHANLCRYDDEGTCWGYRLNTTGLDYTIADILAAVNAVSTVKYERIIWVDEIETTIQPGENFTPAGKMIEYARANGIEYQNRADGPVLTLAWGKYKYHHYEMGETLCNGEVVLRIILAGEK